jgi:hypothetical protein
MRLRRSFLISTTKRVRCFNAVSSVSPKSTTSGLESKIWIGLEKYYSNIRMITLSKNLEHLNRMRIAREKPKFRGKSALYGGANLLKNRKPST